MESTALLVAPVTATVVTTAVNTVIIATHIRRGARSMVAAPNTPAVPNSRATAGSTSDDDARHGEAERATSDECQGNRGDRDSAEIRRDDEDRYGEQDQAGDACGDSEGP